MAEILSAHRAAARCGVSERTVRRWIAAGRLRADKEGGTFRVALEDVSALAGRRRGHAADNGHGADSAAALHTEGATFGADTPRQVSEAPYLADLVRELTADAMAKAESAAMWQARAEVLAHQLDAAQQTIRVLQAPQSHQTHEDPNLTAEGPDPPSEPSEPPSPAPIEPTSNGQHRVRWWRRLTGWL
jgi:excisionase family DNA binding protein